MTWLPLERSGASERGAVLALQPHASALWLEVLASSWSIADPELLGLCRLRIAQMLDCRAELDGADPERLTELASWRSSPNFTLRERAALSYTEQFVVDQNGIAEEQKTDLARFLSRVELCNFVQAVNAHDGYLRTLTLLDVGPDPEASSRSGTDQSPPRRPLAEEPADASVAGLELFDALTDTAFHEARAAFGAATALLDGVDEVTTEACRLRNARQQACRF
jgi:alkylhydroperoxidase family enzyme